MKEAVIGLSEKELYEMYLEINIHSSSLLNLLSKELHSYHAPSESFGILPII